jgi:hypothetical protein
VAGEQRSLSADDLVSWGALSDADARTVVLLEPTGGLPARLVAVQNDQLTVRSDLWGTLVLPRSLIRGVLLHLPIDPLQRDQLAVKVRAFHGSQDHFWLANGDAISGHLVPPPEEPATPSLFGLDTLHVAFAQGGAPKAVPIRGIHAIWLSRSEEVVTNRKAARIVMGFRDGGCIPVQNVSQREDRTALSVSEEVILEAATTQLVSQVVMLQPRGSRVQYVSDLEPIDQAEVPFLEQAWSYGRDHSVAGGRLRCRGRVYLKGLGMHSTSRLVYDLPGGFREFAAELALDDSAGRGGSVTYRVFMERDGGWGSVYESPIVRGGERPLPVRVEINQATRIALVVDYADYGNVLDRANWLNARLVK